VKLLAVCKALASGLTALPWLYRAYRAILVELLASLVSQ